MAAPIVVIAKGSGAAGGAGGAGAGAAGATAGGAPASAAPPGLTSPNGAVNFRAQGGPLNLQNSQTATNQQIYDPRRHSPDGMPQPNSPDPGTVPRSDSPFLDPGHHGIPQTDPGSKLPGNGPVRPHDPVTNRGEGSTPEARQSAPEPQTTPEPRSGSEANLGRTDPAERQAYGAAPDGTTPFERMDRHGPDGVVREASFDRPPMEPSPANRIGRIVPEGATDRPAPAEPDPASRRNLGDPASPDRPPATYGRNDEPIPLRDRRIGAILHLLLKFATLQREETIMNPQVVADQSETPTGKAEDERRKKRGRGSERGGDGRGGDGDGDEGGAKRKRPPKNDARGDRIVRETVPKQVNPPSRRAPRLRPRGRFDPLFLLDIHELIVEANHALDPRHKRDSETKLLATQFVQLDGTRFYFNVHSGVLKVIMPVKLLQADFMLNEPTFVAKLDQENEDFYYDRVTGFTVYKDEDKRWHIGYLPQKAR